MFSFVNVGQVIGSEVWAVALHQSRDCLLMVYSVMCYVEQCPMPSYYRLAVGS